MALKRTESNKIGLNYLLYYFAKNLNFWVAGVFEKCFVLKMNLRRPNWTKNDTKID